MDKYGSYDAPDYDLYAIKTPTAIIHGVYDRLADPQDVEILRQMNLPYVIEDLEFPLGHASFAIAKDMTWFSNDVVNIINKYNN
jgi:hypothetical protein